MNPTRPITHRTERLRLRELIPDDRSFIRRLVNEPGWLRFIGDRDIHSDEDAAEYIRTGPAASYEQHGFGLLLVERCETHEPLGICGLLKRDTLPRPDLGFAFTAEHEGHGYATESGRAILQHARRHLGLTDILAITNPDNHASIRVLTKLGFTPSPHSNILDDRPTMHFTIKLTDCS